MAETWQALGVGPVTGLDWSRADLAGCYDPYFAWLDASRLQSRPVGDDGRVPVSIEIDAARRADFVALADGEDWLTPAYRAAGSGNYCTARVPLQQLSVLQAAGARRARCGGGLPARRTRRRQPRPQRSRSRWR
jgi:hypothetical protein